LGALHEPRVRTPVAGRLGPAPGAAARSPLHCPVRGGSRARTLPCGHPAARRERRPLDARTPISTAAAATTGASVTRGGIWSAAANLTPQLCALAISI